MAEQTIGALATRRRMVEELTEAEGALWDLRAAAGPDLTPMPNETDRALWLEAAERLAISLDRLFRLPIGGEIGQILDFGPAKGPCIEIAEGEDDWGRWRALLALDTSGIYVETSGCETVRVSIGALILTALQVATRGRAPGHGSDRNGKQREGTGGC